MIIKGNVDINLFKYNDMIELECENCHKSFWRQQKRIKSTVKRGLDWMKYCSKECQGMAFRNRVVVKCKNCGKEIIRTVSEITRSGNAFCSSSCSATHNNSHNRNRKFGPSPHKTCKYCTNIVGHKRKVCDKCKDEREKRRVKKRENWKKERIKAMQGRINNLTNKQITISYQTIFQAEYTKKGDAANRFTKIRDNARRIAKRFGLLKACEICGYNKTVAACHIEEVSSFSKDTLIKDVNSLHNLIGLCPNHHWELDHDLLSSEDKEKVRCIIEERTS